MTLSEENYLKAIYHLSKDARDEVSTNAIADAMETKASSVTDMVKKLSEKKLVKYKKYQGVKLTEEGRLYAVNVIRKHRLWEVFLVEKLNFSWDEVHDVAEQLEHIKSDKLVEELDTFLDYPTVDPHGDPIPDKHGKIQPSSKVLLSSLKKGEKGVCVGVKNSSKEFLQYLDKLRISLGDELTVLSREPFDNSVLIRINDSELNVSSLTATNLYVTKT
ncbi:metal-dependent transcriptional regulator [Sinomicrobium weinanense]|uniref:Transcriptional regulator MntR n=1 Tax=Sinomicrobium weinanense TaxID=2842200 RepID=A0A926JPM0_9FLAO|nr:metal-dependent transcriptional regulator [Sinomicrobium weinanense]MBC9794916.1 metal-dependent transcriptional regulator [Sinomicrobium weinanense]MBU3125687.1 metal-dependent transcriptional regulator [Sinomicrobium weinanense]